MGNSPVDKSKDFINEGMTLITETDSDKYLAMSAKRNRNKPKEELYDLSEGGESNELIERWSD